MNKTSFYRSTRFSAMSLRRAATRALFVWLLAGFPLFAYADAIAKLKDFIASAHSGEANFTQEMLDKNGKRIQFVTGTMQFVRPGKFRWSYHKPYEQLIVGDGTKFWLYDVDLNQVTVKKLDAALGSSPAALLSGSNEIERAFTLRDASCDLLQKAGGTPPASAPATEPACNGGRDHDGLEWLEAIPKTPEASVTKILMAFNAQSEVVVVELHDSFGHKTVLHFSNMKRNPQLSPKLFKFEPPKGADVLGD